MPLCFCAKGTKTALLDLLLVKFARFFLFGFLGKLNLLHRLGRILFKKSSGIVNKNAVFLLKISQNTAKLGKCNLPEKRGILQVLTTCQNA